MTVCPHCHQQIAHERLGVRLTPLKAAIVDAMKRAGDVGISSEELMRNLYWDRTPVSVRTIKAHIFQINDALEQTDWVIASDRRRWFLRRRRRAAFLG
jgi:DNA-binding winged helix-turn-helix (wHTH) protein